MKPKRIKKPEVFHRGHKKKDFLEEGIKEKFDPNLSAEVDSAVDEMDQSTDGPWSTGVSNDEPEDS